MEVPKGEDSVSAIRLKRVFRKAVMCLSKITLLCTFLSVGILHTVRALSGMRGAPLSLMGWLARFSSYDSKQNWKRTVKTKLVLNLKRHATPKNPPRISLRVARRGEVGHAHASHTLHACCAHSRTFCWQGCVRSGEACCGEARHVSSGTGRAFRHSMLPLHRLTPRVHAGQTGRCTLRCGAHHAAL